MSKYKNVHLFYYANDLDVAENWDNYKDLVHYGEWINSEILEDIYHDRNRITPENKEKLLSATQSLYQDYPYERLFE